ELSGTNHTIIPDRIEASTFMIMAAAVGDGVLIDNVIPLHLEAVTAKLREMGVIIEIDEESIYIPKQGPLRAVDVKTLVYPGIPTDVQQPLSVLMTQAEGTSIVTDTIYSARFKHIDELRRMNAKARVEGNTAIIQGPSVLQSSAVTATDLRAGAALVLAGLIAKGETEIHDIYHIERGYGGLIEKLCMLGADIRKESIVIKTNKKA
ncbi:MAG: UDP-N-acetylglucosamine 1-carboxyvinyltransferase, partial [Solibacillus sp.]